jgi:hypothetical protein
VIDTKFLCNDVKRGSRKPFSVGVPGGGEGYPSEEDQAFRDVLVILSQCLLANPPGPFGVGFGGCVITFCQVNPRQEVKAAGRLRVVPSPKAVSDPERFSGLCSGLVELFLAQERTGFFHQRVRRGQIVIGGIPGRQGDHKNQHNNRPAQEIPKLHDGGKPLKVHSIANDGPLPRMED